MSFRILLTQPLRHCIAGASWLVGYTRKSKELVLGVDKRAYEVVALLTSPRASKPPGPPMIPFSGFAFSHHIIPVDSPGYSSTGGGIPRKPGYIATSEIQLSRIKKSANSWKPPTWGTVVNKLPNDPENTFRHGDGFPNLSSWL